MPGELTPEENEILADQIRDFNDDLVTYIINLSGQAFNNALKLGAIVMTPVVILLLIVAALLNRISLISFFAFSCAGGMIALGFAALVSTRAKTIALRDGYKEDINPKIVKFLSENGYTRAQFDLLADDILAADAPLREYLVQSGPATGEGKTA